MTPNRYCLSMLAAVSMLYLSSCQPAAFEPPEPLIRPVQVIELSDQQTFDYHQFSGNLKSAKSAAIAFRVPGRIDEMLVSPGDYVEKGQVIARLDPHDFKVAKAEVVARLSEAESAHQLAAIELRRVKLALSDDAISSVTLDRANSGYERSAAMVKVVKNKLQQANDAIAYTELKAPFSGVIGSKNFETFEQVSPGLTVFTLHRLDDLQVEINVPENLIHHFASAKPATASWYGTEAQITAEQIEIETRPDPIKQTYAVTYQLNTEQTATANLLPGKSVTVSVPFEVKNASYCLPYSALTGEGDQRYVYLVRHQRISREDVATESLQTGSVCVTGRLQTSDRVVVSGTQFLKDGDEVKDIIIRDENGERS